VEAPSPPDTPLPPVTAAERRLLADRDGHPNTLRWQQVWRDTFDTTLTIDAVYDSLATTFDQDPKTSTTMTKFGFNPRNEYRVFVKRSGYHDLFAQRNAANEHLYGAAGKPDFSDPSQSASFRYLQSIVDVATEHNIPLIVFIHPYHSDYLEMLHRLGLWQAFEDWKRTLVKVTATQTRAGTVRLFDFADYDDISTERVPPPGDTKSEMHWYWEAGHYKSTLGDELLTAMFAEKPQVGFLLGTDDIDSVLAKIRDDRLQFIATQQGRATQEGRDDNSHAGTLGSAVKPALLAPAQSR
jgi:hypothetical protein